MIITAALPWYDENVEDLEACVEASANIADRLIALDGSYSRYPNGKPRSPRKQVDAIYGAARNAGLECKVILPDRLWLGQVEKRTALLQLASDDTDWIATIDTDHIIHTNRNATRAKLLQVPTSTYVLDVEYVTPMNQERDLADSSSGVWHMEQTKNSFFLPHLWRAVEDMRVERFHWWYSGIIANKRTWLWQGDHRMTPEQREYPRVAHTKLMDYTVEHRCLFRDERHILENRAFCNDREMVWKETGQEDDRPELPRPVFDYKRLPL